MKPNPGMEWQDFEASAFAGDTVARAFGLAYPIDPQSADLVAWLVLLDLGVTAGRIVREPEFRKSPAKAARDAALDRPTIHLAPLWRHPIAGEERGQSALIVPVGAREPAMLAAPVLSRHALTDDDFAGAVADLIAMPLDGSRPLSLTGHTPAVGAAGGAGRFAADPGGRLTLFGNGKAWLDAALARARLLADDTPVHLIEQLHAPFPPATETGALLIEPHAFEWRIARHDCAIPDRAREIACPDSRKLAEWIDAEMRKREKVRSLPVVCGPARDAARAAA